MGWYQQSVMKPSEESNPLKSMNVLVVEDEEAVARTLCLFIERAGMKTYWARNGAEAMRVKGEVHPEVVLVDMQLPDTHGVNLIPWLAKDGDCGIIVVSGSGDEAERIVGIELGADDYVTKPPAMRELVARIRAVHRRVHSRAHIAVEEEPDRTEASAVPDVFLIGTAKCDFRRRRVTDANGALVALTEAEFRALELLLKSKGEAVSRDRLCKAALNRKLGCEDRSVDQLILNIRRKLGGEEEGRQLIGSVRGAGYALRTV